MLSTQVLERPNVPSICCGRDRSACAHCTRAQRVTVCRIALLCGHPQAKHPRLRQRQREEHRQTGRQPNSGITVVAYPRESDFLVAEPRHEVQFTAKVKGFNIASQGRDLAIIQNANWTQSLVLTVFELRFPWLASAPVYIAFR